jgi:minor extracellular serine protease Vpr
MRRIVLSLICAAPFVVAQRIPGSYIVEFKTEPAAALTAAKGARYSSADPEAQARRSQIQTEHQGLEARIQVLGGWVTHRYSTLINGMAVQLTDQAAATVRQMPEVKSVSPVHRHHLLMDQAISVHRINQAWQTLSGGQANAGAGIKIGILDCGVDNTHPAFSSFTTAMPSGFPIVNGGTATTANVNNKVIVARVYSDIANGLDNSRTDASDYCQHGTTVAGIAAAGATNPNFTGIAPLSGVAPGAWIGNYKVADDNGGSDDVTFIAGLEDAVSDGMNVVNYSSGSFIYAPTDEAGAGAAAIAQAVANGVVFVGAAGNAGPLGNGYFGAGLGSISFPAASPAAIAVGAMENQRFFWYGATIGGTPYFAIPSAEELEAVVYVYGDTTGNIVDVAKLTSDPGGYACNSLPANSLTNSIALIQRGSPNTSTCTFQTKLNNAMNAGAVGAIIYDNTNRTYFDYALSGSDVTNYELGLTAPPADANGNSRVVVWSMGTATLPSVMVSQADGQTIKQSIAGGASADIDFDAKTPLPYPANSVADFSSLGPTPLGNLKPDLVAVGDWLVAPSTTTYEVGGCATIGSPNNCYPPYTFLDSPFTLNFFYQFGYGQLFDDGAGTSFASPMVAGSAAVLMAAKPGLTSAQYRSLLTNGAAELDVYPSNTLAVPQTAGAGKLDLLGSLQAGLTAVPATLNFAPVTVATTGSSSSISPVTARIGHHGLSREDAAAAGAAISQTVSITNVGSSSDTFSAVVNSIDAVSTPTVGSASFTLAAGASTNLTVSLPSGLASGQYHGFIVVNGTKGQTPLRVPYWYGVVGPPANILGLYAPGVDPPACTDYIDFRILDASGMPVPTSTNPTVTTASPQAAVVKVYPVSDFVGDYFANNYVPGTFEAQITSGRPDVNGNNVFTISSGSFNQTVTFSIDNSGATLCSNAAATTGTNSRRPVSKLTASKFAGTKKLQNKKAIDQ